MTTVGVLTLVAYNSIMELTREQFSMIEPVRVMSLSSSSIFDHSPVLSVVSPC